MYGHIPCMGESVLVIITPIKSCVPANGSAAQWGQEAAYAARMESLSGYYGNVVVKACPLRPHFGPSDKARIQALAAQFSDLNAKMAAAAQTCPHDAEVSYQIALNQVITDMAAIATHPSVTKNDDGVTFGYKSFDPATGKFDYSGVHMAISGVTIPGGSISGSIDLLNAGGQFNMNLNSGDFDFDGHVNGISGDIIYLTNLNGRAASFYLQGNFGVGGSVYFDESSGNYQLPNGYLGGDAHPSLTISNAPSLSPPR